jgi:hypothetical protein
MSGMSMWQLMLEMWHIEYLHQLTVWHGERWKQIEAQIKKA